MWKLPGEQLSDRPVTRKVKFGGGSVMVWSCMAWNGVGKSFKIDGKMNGDLYVSILNGPLQDSIAQLGKNPLQIIFQQDNDPKHKCHKAKAWFKTHQMEVLQWPAQPPDLNTIEQLWNHLKRKLDAYPTYPRGILEFVKRIYTEWKEIPASVCMNLVESMPESV